MTEEQIIEALRKALSDVDAPIGEFWSCGFITTKIIKATLELISRKNEKIEILRAEKIIAERHEKDAKELFKNAVTELKALKDYIYPLPFATELDKQVEEVKSEAIKEFIKQFEKLVGDSFLRTNPVVIQALDILKIEFKVQDNQES